MMESNTADLDVQNVLKLCSQFQGAMPIVFRAL